MAEEGIPALLTIVNNVLIQSAMPDRFRTTANLKLPSLADLSRSRAAGGSESGEEAGKAYGEVKEVEEEGVGEEVEAEFAFEEGSHAFEDGRWRPRKLGIRAAG